MGPPTPCDEPFSPSANCLPATFGHGAIREMVGAAPVCPPERPRSGVSIRKEHAPSRKGGVSIRRNVCISRMMHTCYRWMPPCRATRAGTQAPPLPASIKPLYYATFLDLVHRRTVRRQPFLVLVHRRTVCRQPFLVLVRRQTVRRQPFLDLVHRRTVRRQPFFDLVHRQTVRQQPFLDLVRRRTVRRHTFLVFVHWRTVRQQPFLVLVRRRTIRRHTFLIFVHRRSLFRQSFSILSVGGASSGDLLHHQIPTRVDESMRL